MIKLLTLLALLASPAHAARSVMEGIVATNTTIMVATQTGRVGIGLANPSYTLHVGGNQQSSGTVYAIGGFASSGSYTGAGNIYISGSFGSTGTVSANKFFGDGSSLTGITGASCSTCAVLIATQTFSGANTFTSSFTIQSGGRQIILSASASVNNINISTGGIVSFSSNTHQSSVTRGFSGSTAATIFSQCFATATVTTAGGDVLVWYTGAMHNSNASQGCLISILQDGAYISGKSNALGFNVITSPSGNLPESASFQTLLKGVAAGTHNWCLTMAALANTCNLTSAVYVDTEFGAMENR